MNAYDYIRRSDLFKDWDIEKRPSKKLVQFAYDFAYQNCESPVPSRGVRDEIIEMLRHLKSGDVVA